MNQTTANDTDVLEGEESNKLVNTAELITNEDDSPVTRDNLKNTQSLTETVYSINILVEEEIRKREQKIQELETIAAKFEEKIDEIKNRHNDELRQMIEETKKKKWCQNCWNEVTFTTFDPPFCSLKCLNDFI